MAAPPAGPLAQIISEVGDSNGTLTAVVTALWPVFANKAHLDPCLQELYVKRAALDTRMAEQSASTDYSVNKEIQESASQLFTHLQAMRGECQTEIIRVESIAHQSRRPQIGAMTKTAPTAPPYADVIDGNDPRFQGVVNRTLNRY